ncbi:potassium voltage-gated channel subfamily C member 3-like [Saccostrea cucullata]|uniref:potassium voltage-gated channel subfamily C member 3-like n=1 Tax=Saccostrea cuccullata TaxID=36930 RepID=UPI002ED02B44
MSDIITLDVGGKFFKTTRKTLMNFPSTRLGKLASGVHNLDTSPFDRNHIIFSNILDFYRHGELHLPTGMCAAVIIKELEYWEIDQSHIAECCLKILTEFEESLQKRIELKKSLDDSEFDYTSKELEQSKTNHVLRHIWLFLDRPNSSKLAFMYSLLFMLITVLSVALFCMDTHPYFRDQIQTLEEIRALMNFTDLFDDVNFDNPKEVVFVTTLTNPGVYNLQIACLAFFTLDLLIHFGSCPAKRKFFRSPLNFLDGFLVFSMWTTTIMEFEEIWSAGRIAGFVYIVFKLCSVFRMFRLLRLIRQHNGLNMLFMAIRSSKWEIVLLLVAFLIFSTFFAGFIYYAEYKEPTTFPNVFDSIWWAIITMTTVGYGDEYPKSVGGRIVGTFCALSGVLIIAMPIAIIASTFSDFNDKNKVRLKIRSFKTRKNKIDVFEMKNEPKEMSSLNSKF